MRKVRHVLVAKIVAYPVLRIGNRVNTNMPAANILIKSVFLALCLFIFNVLEHSAIAIWKGEQISEALTKENTLTKFATAIGTMTIAFIPYHFLKEAQKSSVKTNLFSFLFAGRGSIG